MMRKVLIRFLLIFILVIVALLYFVKFDNKLGKGDYFIYYANPDIIKSSKNSNLYLADIFGIKYDDRYVIACRVPATFYECADSNPILYENYLEYLIIDKKRDKIYVTKKYTSFLKKINDMNIDVLFNEDEIKLIKEKFKKNKHIFNNKISVNHCKKMYDISLFRF